ncbi:MAG: thioredoxin domain-containing protein [Ardenticatenaceae bacterium]|nr:thioredoxin domain-containing protein [Ardenticatenaceae bacterium]HBY96916.1 thioredoxin domain-containing protein [Chloroflexota bacterium]
MANRLANETSPYLLQHKENPVDWYPWSEEALRRAREEDKPIFLSIGYSACHWCHVMEHESFEDPGTAAIMNENFISIKVDREERPDLDAIYMDAVQAMTGSGGWPMSVFLTPEGVPFYGGTYFPSQPQYGMPAFKQVLTGVANVYHERRGDVEQQGRQLLDHLQARARLASRDETLNAEILHRATSMLLRHADMQWGGFGQAPKFPQPMALAFLLRAEARSDNQNARAALRRTLNRMARGGIYDQIGGGFHRYATDQRWLVPHFEKMLYDNGQLVRLYLHAWQRYGDELYRQVAVETLEYVRRQMTHPAGGFYSSQDADSEGEEGKFFVWEPAEMQAVLSPAEWRVVQAYYNVTPGGNWEGKTILWVPRDPDVVAEQLAMTEAEMTVLLEAAKAKLFEVRSRRVPPGKDTKVLTAWNGLMLAAFAEAARVLHRDDYRQVAERNAEFVLTHLRTAGGSLLRSWREGEAKITAFLEDYAALVFGLVKLYEATFEPRWLREASALTEVMAARYWDEDQGGFFDTAAARGGLIVRPKEVIDNATPSGNSLAATALLQLAAYLGDEQMRRAADQTLRLVGQAAGEQPLGFGQWLVAMDFYLSTPLEFALVGSSEGLEPFLRVIEERYLPNKLIAGQAPGEELGDFIPLLADRTQRDGQPTAYLCQHFTCKAPTTDPGALATQIEDALARSG